MVLAWQARLQSNHKFMSQNGRVRATADHDYHLPRASGAELTAQATTVNRLLGNCKAQGTLRNYDSNIRKFEKCPDEKDCGINPASVETVVNFICPLADNKAPLSELVKISPALSLLHHSQGNRKKAAVEVPYMCSLY